MDPPDSSPARLDCDVDWRQLCEESPMGMALVAPDLGLTWANQAFCAPIRLRPREVPTSGLGDLVHRDDLPRFAELTRHAAVGSGRGGSAVLRFRTDSGDLVRLLVAVVGSYDRGGAASGWLVQTADCPQGLDGGAQAEPVADLADVAAEDRRLAALLERSSDIICVVDADGRITYYSPSTQRLLGYSREHWQGIEFASIIHPDDLDELVVEFRKMLREGSGGEPKMSEARIRGWNGDWHHVELVATNRLADPAVAGIVVNVRVVTDRVVAARQLAWQAYHDPLTGLINRTKLNAVLDEVPTPAAHEPLDLALLFIDLDGFKDVNDSLGHHAGDRLLIEVAARLRHEVRGTDTVARLGGDEFVVVVSPAGDADALLGLAERIRVALEAPVDLGPDRARVTASIGIARQGVREPGQLLRRADQALYRAKEAGRNRCEVFSEA